MLEKLEEYYIIQIPKFANTNADFLARLASASQTTFFKTIPVKFLLQPNILAKENKVCLIYTHDSWINPIVNYLKDGKLSEDVGGKKDTYY